MIHWGTLLVTIPIMALTSHQANAAVDITLLRAVSNNRVAVVRKMIKDGAKINVKLPDGSTLLHLAVKSSHPQMVVLLLDSGARVNTKDRNGNTPLHIAADTSQRWGYTTAALMAFRASQTSRNRNRLTPFKRVDKLHGSNESGFPETYELLKKRDTKQAQKVLAKMRCIYAASNIEKHDFETFKHHIAKGADLSSKLNRSAADQQDTLLAWAVGRGEGTAIALLINAKSPIEVGSVKRSIVAGFPDIAKQLVAAGAPVNRDRLDRNKPQTALHKAIESNDRELIYMLLAAKAQIHATTLDRCAPIDLAVKHGSFHVIRQILKRGANSNYQGCSYHTSFVLHAAIMSNRLDLVRLLVYAGAKVDTISTYKKTALQVATSPSTRSRAGARSRAGMDPEIMMALLDHWDAPAIKILEFVKQMDRRSKNLQVIRSTDTWLTPLRTAVAHKGLDQVKAALTTKPNVDTPGPFGSVVLHLAARRGDAGIVELLLTAGANVNIQDMKSKRTPLHYACQFGHRAVVAALLKGGADPSIIDGNGETPLFTAVLAGEIGMVKDLLQAGAKVKVENKNAISLLNALTEQTDGEIVGILVKAGVDVTAQAIAGQDTALHLAIKKGYQAVTRALITELVAAKGNASIPGEGKNTPLHLAVKYGRPEAVHLLLKAGADLHVRNDQDLTPLTAILKTAGTTRVEVLRTLLQAGARVDIKIQDLSLEELLKRPQNIGGACRRFLLKAITEKAEE